MPRRTAPLVRFSAGDGGLVEGAYERWRMAPNAAIVCSIPFVFRERGEGAGPLLLCVVASKAGREFEPEFFLMIELFLLPCPRPEGATSHDVSDVVRRHMRRDFEGNSSLLLSRVWRVGRAKNTESGTRREQLWGLLSPSVGRLCSAAKRSKERRKKASASLTRESVSPL